MPGLIAVGVSGSPSATSRSRALIAYALRQVEGAGCRVRLVDLARLPADGLLGRGPSPDVAAAVETVTSAQIVIVGTPVYRASYSGLLKVFFDLLPQDSLIGKIGVPIVTGHGQAHSLVVDHGLRPLFASLGATVVPSGVYGTGEQFADGGPGPDLARAIDRAVREAIGLAAALPA